MCFIHRNYCHSRWMRSSDGCEGVTL